MALVDPPAQLDGAAVTVMDGPFFSMMPYPSRGKFTLSHVRYTPHASWHDVPGQPLIDAHPLLAHRETRFMHMVRDAARYLPVMRDCRYVDSLWEVKTVMPRSEQDDSRPILLQRNARFPMCLTVLGAKIDSVYDVEDALSASFSSPSATQRPSLAYSFGLSAGGARMIESLISIVAPLEADASAEAVAAFVDEAVTVLRGLVTHHEIIFVDDGAPDDAVARVRSLLSRLDFLRLLRLSRHFGEETAITAGLDVPPLAIT